MFKTNAAGSVANEYVNQNLPGTPGTDVDADDGNIHQDELVAMIEDSGQTLDPTGAKRTQLSEASSIAGGTAESCVNLGTSNALILVQSNSTLKPPSDYSLMTGFLTHWFAVSPNTTAVTCDYEGLGVKNVYFGAAPMTGGEIQQGLGFMVFNVVSDRWDFYFTAGINNTALNSIKMGHLFNGSPESDNVRDRVAKAWVYFDASTGTPIIEASLNIDSITDDGVGLYQVNINVNMPSDTYAVLTGGVSLSTGPASAQDGTNGYIKDAGAFYIDTWDSSSTHGDFEQVFGLIFSN